MTDTKSRAELSDRFLADTFPTVNDRVRHGTLDFADAMHVARKLVDDLYPDAVCAFIHGSGAAGRFKPFSDLDVAVFLPTGDDWALECVEHDGFLFEIHTYPIESADLMISFARFTAQMFSLVVAREGRVLIDRDGRGEALRERFIEAFDAGPLPRPAVMIDELRYMLTGVLIDLLAAEDPDELLAIGNLVFGHIVRLVQALDRRWQHNGKWSTRDIAVTRPTLPPALRAAFARLCDGDARSLAAIGADVLEEAGGGRWVGHSNSFAMAREAELMPLLKVIRARAF